MGRLQALIWAAAISWAVMPAATGTGSEPREPCIPPGTYAPALAGSGGAPEATGRPVSTGEPMPAAEGGRGVAGDVPAVDAVCIPVGAALPPWRDPDTEPSPPRVAVVMTDLRPKDVHLLLDGRDIGPARAFNGSNGFLYLEPGDYLLEARLGGYETVAFRIAARPRCRFDIRQRMQRIKGTSKERPERGTAEKGTLRRVYGPEKASAGRAPAVPAGPDRSLRPDLSAQGVETPRQVRQLASVRLVITPATAEVFLDGEFLATGGELSRLAAPLAISSGDHLLEVSAPGFESRRVEFEARSGEAAEVEVDLQPGSAD